MARQIWSAIIVPLLIFGSVTAQDAEENITLPDDVMSQVVGRILSYQFKPRRTPATIPLAGSQIKAEWLPEIKNITFELVPDKKILEYKNGVLLFEGLAKNGNTYSVNFGWGDLDCSAHGTTWRFRVKLANVFLWRTRYGWGRGCGGGPPVIRGLELSDISPNELKGYEFFAKGRVKNIRLGMSARENIKQIFGNDCENICDYDQNWTVRAEYISDGIAWTTEAGNDKTEFLANEEFIGKLSSLSFYPKKPIKFSRVIFPINRFSRGKSMAIGDAWGINGFEGAVHTSYDTHADGYGLEYTVYDEETFNNLVSKRKEENMRKKGDLIEIEYSIPDALKNRVYYGRPVKKSNVPK